jgi:hypothetical protein
LYIFPEAFSYALLCCSRRCFLLVLRMLSEPTDSEDAANAADAQDAANATDA